MTKDNLMALNELITWAGVDNTYILPELQDYVKRKVFALRFEEAAGLGLSKSMMKAAPTKEEDEQWGWEG